MAEIDPVEPKPYCVTVRDVYGSDFAHLTPPAGYEWSMVDGRAEFRLPLDFDKWLTKQFTLGGTNSTLGQPRLILRERKRRRIVFTEMERRSVVVAGDYHSDETGRRICYVDLDDNQESYCGLRIIYSRTEEQI